MSLCGAIPSSCLAATRGRARWLAARTGPDLAAIWDWGVAERLSAGLLCTRIYLQPLGRDTLAAAEAVTDLMIG